MKTSWSLLVLVFLLLVSGSLIAQVDDRGKIITPLTPRTNPMDPNGDGLVVKPTIPTYPFFSTDGYYVDEFELPMFGIPILGGDAEGDNIGDPCGITDLIPDKPTDGYSVYAYRDPNGNLIFRFRVGNNNASVEAWTILLDVDGAIGAADGDATTGNPGFEIDLTLIKRQNAGVFLYNIDGTDKCTTPLHNYPIADHFQISVGDLASCGDKDYFYDFYVPFADVAAKFNAATNNKYALTESTKLRYAAVTNVSATCAMDGNIADISGVDYNDYRNNVTAAWIALIEAQCGTPVEDLVEGGEGFNSDLPYTPSINIAGVTVGATSVSGQVKNNPDVGPAPSGIFVRVQVFTSAGVLKDEIIASVTNGTWSVNLSPGVQLEPLDKIRVRVQLNVEGTGCGTGSGSEVEAVTDVPPDPKDDTYTTNEDTPLNANVSLNDIPSDILAKGGVYSLFSAPANGTAVVNANGTITYTPGLNYNGPDQFVYRLCVGLACANATVFITVIPVNDPPDAVDDSFTMNESTAALNTVLNNTVATNDTDVDGPAANYTLISGPSGPPPASLGNLIFNADGSFTYTPALNYNSTINGNITFVYSLCDGGSPLSLCDQATVTIVINPVNSPPEAEDDQFTTDEDVAIVNASVAGNDTDPDGPGAIYTLVTGNNPTKGTLTFNSNGTFTYTPILNYNSSIAGNDQFVYQRCDGANPSLCDQATVTIIINPINDAPDAVNDSFTMSESTAAQNTSLTNTVATNDTDVDGPAANYTLISGPSGPPAPSLGNLVFNSDGTFTYTPALNYNSTISGNITFVYSRCDGGTPDLCDQATVTIIINAVNSPPEAEDDQFTTDEDVAIVNASVVGNDTDPDGPGAIYSLVTGNNPTKGTLTFNSNGTFTYTPILNYNSSIAGNDQFVYQRCDGANPSLCDQATVTIIINPINDAPDAVNDSFTINENTVLNNTVATNDTDVDGPAANYTLISGPSGPPAPSLGNLVFNADGTFTYTPALNYNSLINGNITFVYSRCDGGTPDLCDQATVTIIINSANSAPVANDDSFTTDEDKAIENASVAGNDTDSDGPAAIYSLVSGPTNGTLVFNTNGTFTYTPNSNFNSPPTDQFVYSLCDGGNPSLCDQATVTITVNPLNDPPVITGSLAATVYSLGVVVDPTLQVTDVDNTTLTGVVVSITGNFSSTFDFLDFTNQNGITGSYNSTTGVLTLSGSASLANYTTAIASIQYRNLGASSLTRTITFVANDGSANSLPWNTFIDFPGNNFPPELLPPTTFHTDEDVTLVECLNVKDDDGDAVTIKSFTVTEGAGLGTFTLTGGTCFTFKPGADLFGTVKINVELCDVVNAPDVSQCIIEEIIIIIDPINDAPIAQDDVFTMNENATLSANLAANNGNGVDSDVDGPGAIYTLVSGPTGPAPVTFTLNPDGTFVYTPFLNYNSSIGGDIFFTYKRCDGGTPDLCDEATVRIIINEINNPPIAVDDSFTTDEDVALNASVTGNDSDVDGPGATYSKISDPIHGSLIFNSDGTFTYTPTPDYNSSIAGDDQFIYERCDGGSPNACDQATVTIIITPVNDRPIAINQAVDVIEDTPKVITLTGTDIDNDQADLIYTITQLPAHGTLSVAGNPYTYIPNLDYNGPDVIKFIVNDGALDSDPAGVITINVLPVNDQPQVIVNNNPVTTVLVPGLEDTPTPFCIDASDVDGDILSINTPTNVSGGGTLVPGVNGANQFCFVFTPVPDFNGKSIWQATVCDNGNPVLCTIITIEIDVAPVNDAPVGVAQTIEVIEDTPKEIILEATDVDNAQADLTFNIIQFPAHGTLTPGTNGNPFTYTPDPDYYGPDSFTFVANDGGLDSDEVTILINVLPVNDPPVVTRNGEAVDLNFPVRTSTLEDTPVDLCFKGFDPDPDDELNIGTITNTLGGGTLVPGTRVLGLDGQVEFCFTFTPAANFNGLATWEVTVCDDASPSLCKVVKIEIDVIPVQDAPVAVDQVVTVIEDTPKPIMLEATDPDGDVLTYTIVTGPMHGKLSGSGANVIYTPNLNYSGPDSFTFRVNDGTVDSNIATVSINVTPVNDAPVISTIPILYTPEDTSLEVCLQASDVDSNMITYSLPTNISGGGTMAPSTQSCFLFTPVKDYNGDTFWRFRVCDNANPAACTEIIVQIVVTPVNDPPIAVNDFITVQSYTKSEPFNILANDTDIENDKLVLTTTPVAGPFHGTITMTADGLFSYQSVLGFIGADSVRYKVCDTGVPSLCDEGVVFIEVGPAPFKIYNGFSPNGDGLNEYWRIDGIESYPNNKIRVFDRYNNLIFETTGYTNDGNNWRGQTNHSMISGNLPEGTYFYAVDLGDGSELLSGYIVLKKN